MSIKELDELRRRPVLVLCSTGGHLDQALRWAERLDFAEMSTFVTFENSQSASRLNGRARVFVPYIPPRGYRRVIDVTRRLIQDVDAAPFHAIFSTGAGIALAGLPLAWQSRRPYVYVESVSRFSGPSLTGRLLRRMPGVSLFTQHQGYADEKWVFSGSLLDDYMAEVEGARDSSSRPLRIFVTLGTIHPYRFDRLVAGVLAALTPADHVCWQTGATRRADLVGLVEPALSSERFDELVMTSDAIVTHAGVGNLMRILDLGKQPVVLPRLARYEEHVDNHQLQVANHLAQRGLIRLLPPGCSGHETRFALQEAARTVVRRRMSDAAAGALGRAT